jgi:hypothetical protein
LIVLRDRIFSYPIFNPRQESRILAGITILVQLVVTPIRSDDDEDDGEEGDVIL